MEERVMIKGRNLIVDDLSIEDAYQMRNWRRAEGLLKREYHFLMDKNGDVERWYSNRINRKNIRSFAVRTYDGTTVGFISIRNINKIFRTSTLGITLNMDYIERGYGTESLKLFLEYYFNILNMKKLYLDVARHNQRAINCYKRVGFIFKRRYYAFLEEDYINLVKDELKKNGHKYSGYFSTIGTSILIAYEKMYITKKMYDLLSTEDC